MGLQAGRNRAKASPAKDDPADDDPAKWSDLCAHDAQPGEHPDD
jgi:hypothetical protein